MGGLQALPRHHTLPTQGEACRHPSPPLRPPEAPNKADWAALSPFPAPPLLSLGQLMGELGTTPHHEWVGAGTCSALKGNTPNQPSFLKTIGDLFKDAPTSAVPSRHKAWALGLRLQGWASKRLLRITIKLNLCPGWSWGKALPKSSCSSSLCHGNTSPAEP